MAWFASNPTFPPPEFDPPSTDSLPPLTEAEARWSRILTDQLDSIRAVAPPLIGFLDAHFTPPLTDYLARRTEEEMRSTVADNSPRCFTFRQVDAWHIVLTTPVRKDAARDWFAHTYGSYPAFLEPYWSRSRNPWRVWGVQARLEWGVLCQTTFGAPGWCEVAVVPARWCAELPTAWPQEFLTDDELRSMSLP